MTPQPLEEFMTQELIKIFNLMFHPIHPSENNAREHLICIHHLLVRSVERSFQENFGNVFVENICCRGSLPKLIDLACINENI